MSPRRRPLQELLAGVRAAFFGRYSAANRNGSQPFPIRFDANHRASSLRARARQQKALPEIELRLASCDRNRLEVIAEFHDLWLVADGLPLGETLSIRIAMHHEVC